VREEFGSTPRATYEVLTDVDGHLSAAIEVASDSDIVIESKDQSIAQLSLAGAASEFAIGAQAVVQATPMIEAVGACRISDGAEEFVRFTYNNLNDSQDSVFVPLTILDPTLSRREDTLLDDLLLNYTGYEDGNHTLPYTPDEDPQPYQRFEPGQQSFLVRYYPSLGAVTWKFIGSSIRADGTTPLCLEEGLQSCSRISDDLVSKIMQEARQSVTGLLKLAAKSRKKGRVAYLKSCATALRGIRDTLAELQELYACPVDARLRANCSRRQFPHAQLKRMHAGIFQVKAGDHKKAFSRLRQAHTKRFESFLAGAFPHEVVKCLGAGQRGN
jgi:hypothetical protein